MYGDNNGFPNQQLMPSQNAVDAGYVDACKTQNDIIIHNAIAVDNLSNELARIRAVEAEGQRLRGIRDLSYNRIENSEGILYWSRHWINPENGNDESRSTRLLNIRMMRLVKIPHIYTGGQTIEYRIMWWDQDNHEHTDEIESLTVKMLATFLIGHSIKILVDPLLRNSVISELISFLNSNIKEEEATYEFIGWRKDDHSHWRFRNDPVVEGEISQSYDFAQITYLKALALNFPLTQDTNCYLSSPVGIFSNNPQQVIRLLKVTDSPKVIQSDQKRKEIQQILKKANSEYVFYLYRNTPRGRQIFDMLSEASKTGIIDDSPLRALILIIFDTSVSERIANNCKMIEIDETMGLACLPTPFCHPKEENVSELLKKNKATDYFGFVEHLLLTSRNYGTEIAGVMQKVSRNLQKMNDAVVSESENLIIGVKEQCYRITSALPKADVSVSVAFYDKRMIFYDSNYLYFTNESFKQIFRDILAISPGQDRLKKVLFDAGILVPTKSCEYTARVRIDTDKGSIGFNFIRMDLNKLNIFGRLALVDILNERSKEKKHE